MKPRYLGQRHFSMFRDFHLADWLTLANAFCGVCAMFFAMRYMQSGEKHDLIWGIAAGTLLALALRRLRA